MSAMPIMPEIAAMRPLVIMLRALGYAALPAWPAGIAAAVAWTGRAELLLLSVAWIGTTCALTLVVLRWAEARLARRAAEHEAQMAAQAARYDRLEGRLCGVIVDDLRPRRYRVARTLPDLRVVR
jgi:membrane protein implicated in regulation of membrane protease activity